MPHGKAGFGSTVHLKASSGDLIVYQLVMPDEADAEKGLISTSSPIGRAILNKEEGDEVKVVTPNGNKTFELVKLEGLSVAEAAEVLGITRGMVKIRSHRATVALRETTARRLRGSPERTTPQPPRAPRPRDISERGMPT